MLRPIELRKGQTIANFLSWLRHFRNIKPPCDEDSMADPYYIKDEDWDCYWQEFMKFCGVEDRLRGDMLDQAAKIISLFLQYSTGSNEMLPGERIYNSARARAKEWLKNHEERKAT